MFSNKENVNILTALLIANGVDRAVVCPGSRNAPINLNLAACGKIACTSVTDERSAGFVALGMALSTRRPVVVCVTSGSALLNLAPSVAEACYRHVPLIVVSADRPEAWIGQLDGQTLPQPGALGCFVRRSVTLPEPADDVQRWHCRRLVAEALYLATHREGAPVHINVPISEPLFTFDQPALPAIRPIKAVDIAPCSQPHLEALSGFTRARRPMIVIGQTDGRLVDAAVLRRLASRFVVLCEPLGGDVTVHFDEILHAIGPDRDFMPDAVLYVGDTIVSKRARKFLRLAAPTVWLLTADASALPDPLMGLEHVVECPDVAAVGRLLRALAESDDAGNIGSPDDSAADSERRAFVERWTERLKQADTVADAFAAGYSQLAVVNYLEQQVADLDAEIALHYANSSAIRLANICANHYVWCNRGVNGIEGSLSTAAGFALASDGLVVCVIGDLSFFYDQNALWNDALGGNLRIVLLNNHCGGIFSTLSGLQANQAAQQYVAAGHKASARGICEQNDVGYLAARNMDEARIGIVTLLTRQASRPMLLEIVTDAAVDAAELARYFACFK